MNKAERPESGVSLAGDNGFACQHGCVSGIGASRRCSGDDRAGKVGMHIVGLPDKAVAESRERVQAALHASGLSMPAKKVTINLAPADLPKEGSHYDLPIALA
jgi:hypothetical protein